MLTILASNIEAQIVYIFCFSRVSLQPLFVCMISCMNSDVVIVVILGRFQPPRRQRLIFGLNTVYIIQIYIYIYICSGRGHS